MRSSVALIWILSVMACCSGCGDLIPPRPPIGPAEEPQVETPEPDSGPSVVVEAPRQRFTSDWSDTYVFRIGNRVVGISETDAKAMIDSELLRTGDPEVRFERLERLIYRTGDTQFMQRRRIESVESFDGVLKSFESEASTGPMVIRHQGNRTKETIRIDSVRGRETESKQLKWDSTTRGLFAISQTLRRTPIEVGETRRLRVLLPSFQEFGLITMRCTGEASIAMLDDEYRLLREVEIEMTSEDRVVDRMVAWVDENGIVQKSLRPSIRLEAIRIERPVARRLFSGQQDDQVTVIARGELQAADAETVALEVTDSDGRPPSEWSIFAPALRQSVRPIETRLQVLVSSAPPPAGFLEYESTSRPIDLGATAILDYDEANVARMSKTVGDLPDGELMIELAHVVRNILSIAPQRGVRRSSVVLRSGEGGELDHAVLLASLLRSRGVAARVVFGLTPSSRPNAVPGKVLLYLRSWVIASAEGQWTVIDPVRAETDQSLRITLSECEGDADLRLRLDELFRALSRTSIEIKGVR